MLAIKAQSSVQRLTPNLLPCSIKHSGPVSTSQHHWDPQTHVAAKSGEAANADQQDQVAYFRGRKLLGKTVKLPADYTGIVLEKSDEKHPSTATEPGARKDDSADFGEDGDAPMEEVHLLNTTAHFDRIVVWGHEELSQDDDTYVKGISEWMGFAQAMHDVRPHPDSS